MRSTNSPSPALAAPAAGWLRPLRQGLGLACGLGLALPLVEGALWAVGRPPEILVQPQAQYVPQGSNAYFSVTASSGTAMTYQWRFYGMNIAGATNSTLAIYSVQPAQAGWYSVAVQNALGATYSSNATLTLFVPRVFSNAAPVAVPNPGPAVPYPAFIEVAGVAGQPAKVAVTLQKLSHPFPDALDILLQGPTGTQVVLMSDAGNGYGIEGANLRFDDEAAGQLPDFGPITSGAFKPTNQPPDDDFLPLGPFGPFASELEALSGSDPDGPWALYVASDTSSGGGEIQGGWQLHLHFEVPIVNAYYVALAGNREVPATGSPGYGSGTVMVQSNGAVTYQIAYEGLIGDFAGASIHGPANTNANAVPLFNLTNQASGPRAGTLRGTLINYSGNQLWALRSELHYVNIRSTAYPTGEIRGQIVALPPPVILEHPQGRTVAAGDDVSFSVSATSFVPVRHQWRFDGKALSWETNGTLTLHSVQSTNAGAYDVVVSNPAGYVVSTAAILVVTEPVPIEFVSILPGESGALWFDNYGTNQGGHQTPCGWMSGFAQWKGLLPLAGGTLIVDTKGSGIDTLMAVYEGTNRAQLQYRLCNDNAPADGLSSWARFSVEAHQGWVFEVDGVSGAVGSIQLNWRLGEAPAIARQPASQSVAVGGTAVFQALASGLPPPAYQWQFNGLDLADATNASLTVSPAQMQNAGQYRVIASNFVGAAVSTDALLRVLVPPLLSAPKLDGQAIHFQVTTSAGAAVIVEASPDLAQWEAISTNSAPDGVVTFADPLMANRPQRFYRARVY